MTMCTAWVRQANDTEELVFATDSCLTGGEKWKHGIKLFELPRKDCLLCFAGDTMRAYPLVLNLVSSIHLDKYLQSPSATLEEGLEFLSEIFTKLVKTITEVEKSKRKLRLIFKDVAYRQFLVNQETEQVQLEAGDDL